MQTRYAIAVALSTALGASFPAAAEPSTVRIETRAFYGATITLEEGVRVFRPLPPHSHVVINPGGRTPLHLSIGDDQRPVSNYAKAVATGGTASSEASEAVSGLGARHHRPHGKPPVGRTHHGQSPQHAPGPARN